MREFHRAPRGYELMVLINPEVTDEALSAAVDQISGYVTSNGAEIHYLKRDTPWGRRRLAYPIERFRDATYVLYQFLGSPTVLTDIERELKLDERIIRYLLVRQEHLHVSDEETASTEEISSGEVAAETESDTTEPDTVVEESDVEDAAEGSDEDEENEDEESDNTEE